MKAGDRSRRVHVLRTTGASVNLIPEHLMVIIGCFVAARSLLDARHHGAELIWCVGLAGALVVILAITTIARPMPWPCWAQVTLGFGLCFGPFFLTFDAPDFVTVAVGFAISSLAATELDAIDAARTRPASRLAKAPAPPRTRAAAGPFLP
jgi:hypothetical protein